MRVVVTHNEVGDRVSEVVGRDVANRELPPPIRLDERPVRVRSEPVEFNKLLKQLTKDVLRGEAVSPVLVLLVYVLCIELDYICIAMNARNTTQIIIQFSANSRLWPAFRVRGSRAIQRR